MTKRTVYLETSVISYATSRPSRDLVVAARQQVTRQWFVRDAGAFDLFVSELVLAEAMEGDPLAVAERRSLIEGIPILAITNAAGDLGAKLVHERAVPEDAEEDALHIAVAAVHGVDFLLTWNCRHIANAAMREGIEGVCTRCGFEPPVMCTPEELTHEDR
jgi:hypothetical protein